MSEVYIKGPVMYPRIFEDTRDKEGFEGKYKDHGGMYELTVGLDDDDLAVALKWNKNYEPKHLGDKAFTEERNAQEGVHYLTFKRKHEAKKRDGDLIPEWSGPPEVVDAEGNPWDKSVAIGNGSICTVKLDVRKPKGGRFTYVRLDKVRVDELVEYEGGTEYEEVDVPEQDDVIPF